MADFIPGRHLAYWDAWSADGIQAANELMEETLAEHGPFDGALAYSQGGAFVLGYCLQHLIDRPGVPLPFKFVCFFGTAAALSADPEYKTKEIMAALNQLTDEEKDELHEGFISRKGHKDPREFSVIKENKVQGKEREIFIALIDMVQASLGARNFFGIDESDETNAIDDDSYNLEDFPRFFNAVYTTQKINIPTVHVRGLRDDPAPLKLAELAQEMCDPTMTQLVRYDGVHEIPHKAEDVLRIRQAIDKAYVMGQSNHFDIPKISTRPMEQAVMVAA